MKAYPQTSATVPATPSAAEPLENYQGMDLRDYFAAKAMQAIIAKQPHLTKPIIFFAEEKVKAVAAGAYFYADAMLIEKNNWENTND